MRYVILPNATPTGKFEAHLEVLSGSAHELEHQQGMAHLLEHVAWMGSPKRQAMSGTGSKANAYTDFHHTVFYASCPCVLDDGRQRKSMLPLAFNALVDVMSTTVTSGRLEKERAVVLSEASMVNTMEYRVEIQILSALHRENRISRRFPIGLIPMIKSWTMAEVQQYHDTHYQPKNAILYVVGDVNPAEVEKVINQKFGGLKASLDQEKLLKDAGEYPDVSMRNMSPHFPPVVHNWSTKEELSLNHLPAEQVHAKDSYVLEANGIVTEDTNTVLPEPTIFQHELMQSFSFHLFAKRPIEPVVDVTSLKRELMRKIAIASLQIRFNVVQRNDPLFISVEFNQTNWPREGCAVCSLDLNADVSRWQDAIRGAVLEIRRLGEHGISASELARYKTAILSESVMLAAQADQLESEHVVQWLMEATACGHTFMHPEESLEYTRTAIESITLEEVNGICKELSEHLSHPVPEAGIRPSAIIACGPAIDRNGQPFKLTAEAVSGLIQDAIAEEVVPMHDIEVPESLFTAEDLAAGGAEPQFVEFEPKAPAGVPPQPPTLGVYDGVSGVMQRRLGNGIAVNLKTMNTEPQRGNIRLSVPGGRALEAADLPGVMTLGARTMQECGGFGRFSRESVELFCIDHLLMVEILSHQDMFTVDFVFPTTPGGATGEVTGLEAAMQVLRVIVNHLEWEEDGFERARQALHQSYQSILKNLDLRCQEEVISTLTDGNYQFCHPTHAQIDAITLTDVKEAVGKMFGNTPDIEISISADASIEELEALSLKYLGTIPPRSTEPMPALPPVPHVDELVQGPNNNKAIEVLLNDTDERAMGYLGGYAPNHWGIDRNGKSLGDALNELAEKDALNSLSDADVTRRAHPLFGRAVQAIFREVATRRLFSIVREERQLTYDATFMFQGFERINGGMYMVSVTTSPEQAQQAVQACKEALNSLTVPFGITSESIQAAKRTLLNNYEADITTNKYWVEVLARTQLDANPAKTLNAVHEYRDVVQSVTVSDVQLLAEYMDFKNGTTMALTGISGPNVEEPTEEAPVVGAGI